MEKELQKLVGQQVPIKTRTGGRMMEYITEVHADVVVLATNADGSGRRTLLALDCIESVTTGGAGAPGAAAAKPNWMPAS